MNTSLRISSIAIVAIVVMTTVALQVRTSETPAAATYVGQDNCLSCHAGAYSPTSDYQGAAEFKRTLHQKIHLRPNPETVVIEKYFAGDSVIRALLPQLPISGMDTLLISLSKSDDGREYYAQLRFSGGGDSTPRMKIAYTYGGYGWIQRFLVEVDGSFYVLPFQYILPAYKERSDTSNSFYFLDFFRWFELDQSTGQGRFFRFNTNKFRTQSWDKDCAFCHVNGFGLVKRVSGQDTAFFATWAGREEDSVTQDANILIGCESCHGPGSEHATFPTKTNIFSPGLLPRTKAATDVKLDLCNSCHTRVRSTLGTYRYPYDEQNNKPWLPGELLAPYFRHAFNDAQYWPDRVTSYAHHQSGQDFWRGAPYEKHVFADGCWDCHTVHTEGRNGLPYQLKKDYYSTTDGVGCLECHGSSGESRTPPLADLSKTSLRNGRVVNTHTQHELASSACVNCHFTKAATISFVDLPRKPAYEFSQHDFRVVRPIATIEYKDGVTIGMMNTCAASCHRNGRGSRNTPDSLPAAPAFGTVDRNLGLWKEPSDVELADSLWYHYQRMFGRGAVRDGDAVAGKLAIVSIAPNPVRERASIRFSLPRRADVRLEVYDIAGKRVRTLATGVLDGGSYTETWKGNDELGAPVDAGTYIIRLRAGGHTASGKIVVVR